MKLSALPLLLLAVPVTLPASAGTTPPAAAKTPAKPLPFIEDDFARALSEARSKKLPLFIEVWAPW